ncbi:hypothetical protein F7725_008947, partial [Dissostichus mawsoni]
MMSDMQTENTQRLKEREQELKDMKKMMEVTKRSSDMVHDDTDQVLSELQRSVERLQELLEEVLDQASMQKMGQAQEVTDSLEAEVKELRKRDKEMKDLLRSSFEPVRDAILDLRDKIEDICNQELGKITNKLIAQDTKEGFLNPLLWEPVLTDEDLLISQLINCFLTVNLGLFLDYPTDTMTQAPAFPGLREINLDSIQAPEPRTREEFLQYSMTLTLDTNTAHRRLSLSEGNTKATLQGAAQ